jgi:DNA (cytosine-5)-methyltransferase 1
MGLSIAFGHIKNHEGYIAIEVYEADSEPMRKIKEFMALYGIADIKMRMLKIPELKRIMGFPENYKLVGTQADQKKFIGNAVEVNIARVLCEALVEELNITLKKVA